MDEITIIRGVCISIPATKNLSFDDLKKTDVFSHISDKEAAYRELYAMLHPEVKATVKPDIKADPKPDVKQDVKD